MVCPFSRNNGFGTGPCRNCGYAQRTARRAAGNGRIQCGGTFADAVGAAETLETMRRRGCTQCADGGDAFCCGADEREFTSCGDAVGRELYGAPASNTAVYTTCSDACAGRSEYRIVDRNPFWPSFARPRWLTCDELYGCDGRR